MRGTSRRLSLSDLPADVLALNGLTAEAKRTKPGKYRNEREVVDGITFASQREAAHYAELKVRLLIGEIRDLRCQPVFDLHGVNAEGQRVRIARFRPDFEYALVESGELIVVDVKSQPTRTTAYMLRKRLFEAEYGPLLETF